MSTQAKQSGKLYEDVVHVTRKYFGPASDRFVARQIQEHLSKSPTRLQRRDLVTLIDWISLTMALLIEDEAIINQYISELRLLAER